MCGVDNLTLLIQGYRDCNCLLAKLLDQEGGGQEEPEMVSWCFSLKYNRNVGNQETKDHQRDYLQEETLYT